MASGFSEPLQQLDRTFVRWRGRRLIYFAGCDYLRLSWHPKIIRAVKSSTTEYGLNVAASRRTTGNHVLYEKLEAATAKFFAVERAVLVSTGYLTNIAAAQGLRGAVDHVLIDDHAHSSLRDAVKFLGCGQTEFAHRNAADLERKVRKLSGRKRIAVMTDGMFANDGAIAPLAAYREIVGRQALLWIDDAHAAGILGPRGRGTVEWTGISRRNVIQTITFSKAFGAYGGAILCDRKQGASVIEGSPAMMGNTPLPLPLAAAALTALEINRTEPRHREKLWRNVALFWKEMGRAPEALSPIISVSMRNTAALKRQLLANGIHPPLIEYGSGPAYFRFVISSEHTAEQIRKLARTLAASSERWKS
jgi:8-amino-7-oxononanoate synthase